jgi:DUF1009 family protein
MGHITLMPGILTSHKPSNQQIIDIMTGQEIISTLGKFDIGQALVIENGLVLGIEAAEGTDRLISRTKTLQKENKQAILVKCAKPQQDKRADLPTIGTDTITTLYENGFAGIAIEAHNTIILNHHQVINLANEHGLFIYVFSSK